MQRLVANSRRAQGKRYLRFSESGEGAVQRTSEAISAALKTSSLSLGVATAPNTPSLDACDISVVSRSDDETALATILEGENMHHHHHHHHPVTWTSEGGAVPEDLATFIALDPTTLVFAIVSRSDVEPLLGRLESLFPGAAALCAVVGEEYSVRLRGSEVDIAGAVAVDLNIRDVSKALCEMSPLGMRTNDNASRVLFGPTEPMDEAKSDESYLNDLHQVPVFAQHKVLVFPNETAQFYVFEPRYKWMIKECIDRKRPFVIADLDIDGLGALCRLVSFEQSSADLSSFITVRGLCRVRIGSHVQNRTEFGLFRADLSTVRDDEPSQKLDPAHFPPELVPFTTMLGDQDEQELERVTWKLANWLNVGAVNHNIKRIWFDTTDTKVRLTSQLELITRIVKVQCAMLTRAHEKQKAILYQLSTARRSAEVNRSQPIQRIRVTATTVHHNPTLRVKKVYPLLPLPPPPCTKKTARAE